MTRACHRAFSPDFALSYFDLFEKLKNGAKGCLFDNANEPFLGRMSEVSKISREELEAVFDEPLLGLGRYISMNGRSTSRMIWMMKFWLSEKNFRFNRLIQELRHYLLLLRQCCSIYMNSFGSNHSICSCFDIRGEVIDWKNERSMQGPCIHSCMMPNGTAGIFL
jgi:hypothetical protein